MVESTTRDDRPADLRRVLVVAGWVAAGFVAVGTALGELPDGTERAVVVTLTVVGLGLWRVSLNPRVTDQRLLFACLVGAGLLGAIIDRLNRHGPGRTGREDQLLQLLCQCLHLSFDRDEIGDLLGGEPAAGLACHIAGLDRGEDRLGLTGGDVPLWR